MCPGGLSFGFTKFDNAQRALLEHPAKKLNFTLEGGRGAKLVFLSNGGAAVFLHDLHVAPLDAEDPIQCSRPAARPPRPAPGASFPHNPLRYKIIYVQRDHFAISLRSAKSAATERRPRDHNVRSRETKSRIPAERRNTSRPTRLQIRPTSHK